MEMSARRVLNLRVYAALYFQVGQFFLIKIYTSTPYGHHKKHSHTRAQIRYTQKEIKEKFFAELAKIKKKAKKESGNANYDFV